MNAKRYVAQALLACALLAGTIACAGDNGGRRTVGTVGTDGWIFEGWACAPNAAKARLGKTPGDYCRGVENPSYLYMKFSAAASQGAIQSNMISKMMATCREAARLQVAGDGLAKTVGEYLQKASGQKDGQSTGVAIISRAAGKIRGVGLYDCCPIDNDSGACIKPGKRQNWAQCMCVGYMKFPGGQKAFTSQAEAIRKERAARKKRQARAPRVRPLGRAFPPASPLHRTRPL